MAGYDTQEYLLTTEGTSSAVRIWVAPALKNPMEEDVAMLLQSIAGEMAKGVGGTAPKEWGDEFTKIKGFQLAITFQVQTEGEPFEFSIEATKVSTAPIPAKVFAIPAGYKQLKLPMPEVQPEPLP